MSVNRPGRDSSAAHCGLLPATGNGTRAGAHGGRPQPPSPLSSMTPCLRHRFLVALVRKSRNSLRRDSMDSIWLDDPGPMQRGSPPELGVVPMRRRKSESILPVPPVTDRRRARKAVTAFVADRKVCSSSYSPYADQYRARIGIARLVFISAINLRHSFKESDSSGPRALTPRPSIAVLSQYCNRNSAGQEHDGVGPLQTRLDLSQDSARPSTAVRHPHGVQGELVRSENLVRVNEAILG